MVHLKKLLLKFLAVSVISFSFIGGDCSTDDNTPEPPTVAPPESVSLSISANPGGGDSYAVISWTASPDENNGDFEGYRVVTHILNAANEPRTHFDEHLLQGSVHSYRIDEIERSTRYRSVVIAELSDGTRSTDVETIVYAGVFYNINGTIDNFINNDNNSQSGYGWDATTGNGSPYLYISENANAIDLHLRTTSNMLFFYSPDIFNNSFKNTKIEEIGSGQNDFNNAEIVEPDETVAQANENSVYVLKTEDNIYIKIWVTDIEGSGDQSTVKFSYKLQPIENLRVVKR